MITRLAIVAKWTLRVSADLRVLKESTIELGDAIRILKKIGHPTIAEIAL